MGKDIKPFVGKTCRYLSNVKSAITIEQIARVLKLPLELVRSQLEEFE